MKPAASAPNALPPHAGPFSPTSVLAVTGVLCVSLTAMRLLNLQFALPFSFLVLLLVVFPFSFGLARVIVYLDGSILLSRWQPVIGPLVGLTALSLYWPDRRWFLYPAVMVCSWLVVRSSGKPHHRSERRMAFILLMVTAIYIVVWNANYVALIASRSRLHDAWARSVDEAVYSAIVGRT